MKLKCFVACAFDHPDVDVTFDIIKSVLESLNIISLRVDKITHNDKIDQKIIELIKSCDFGIADLTYGRQSVYYEAGYLHGLGKQVIFTCRSDHFGGTADSTKIHFDLITHNIIPWRDNTEMFAIELKTRIEQLIVPLIKKSENNKKQEESRKQFTLLSLTAKLDAMTSYVNKFFVYLGYDTKVSPEVQGELAGIKKLDDGQESVIFGVVKKTTNHTEIKNMWETQSKRLYSLVGINNPEAVRTTGETIVVYCLLSRIVDVTVQEGLPDFSKVDTPFMVYERKGSHGHQKMIFLVDVKSVDELRLYLIYNLQPHLIPKN